MAFDLGDPVPLTFLTKDASGAAANVTTAVLTLTLPDGTAVTPAVGAPSPVGTYAPATPYISAQAGIHRVSWVGSGTNAQDYTDTFNVLAADPRFLISLADARTGLGTNIRDTVKDEDLRAYIAAATPIIEDIVGPILRTACTDTHDGGRSRLVLLRTPLISVTSVIESYGTYLRTLTAQNLFDGSSVGAYGYTVDLSTGLLTRRVSGVEAPFPAGRRNVQVVYVAGRSSVTGNILLATRRLIRHLWQQEQQGYRPNMGGPDTSMGTTPMGFAVPKAVLEMCADSTRAPGIA